VLCSCCPNPMFNSFKGLFSKATESAKASVDSLNSKFGETVKPLQDQTAQRIKQVDLEKPKKVLASLKDETQKIGNEILAPGATFVLAPKYYSENVEITAGLELLHKYEHELLAIHTCSKNVASKAEIADKKIAPVYQYCLQQNEAWNKFRKELNLIPEISNTIAKIHAEIEGICSRMDLLEVALTEQTEEVQALQLQTFKQHQVNLTELYRRKKELGVEEAEQELRIAAFKREQQRLELEKIKATERMTEQMIKAKEKERADRIREQEILLEREREQTKMRDSLSRAFQDELAAYKASQNKPKKEKKKKKRTTRKPAQKSLETVVFSESDTALEEFLGPEESDEEEEENFSKTESDAEPNKQSLLVTEISPEGVTSPQNERKEKEVPATPVKDEKKEEVAAVADVDDSWM